VTIVQLSELDDFLKDSLSIVRRGVASARNANQSNPALGIMADLPERVDFEVMVVSNHQYLNRITSTSSLDNSSIHEISGSGEHGTSGTTSSSLESDAKIDSRNENSNESSTTTNKKISTSSQGSSEGTKDGSQGTSTEKDQSNSTGGGSGGGNESGTKTEKRNSNNNASDSKSEKSQSRQQGRTQEANTHQVKGFDQATGRWGGQMFAPVAPIPQSLKCS